MYQVINTYNYLSFPKYVNNQVISFMTEISARLLHIRLLLGLTVVQMFKPTYIHTSFYPPRQKLNSCCVLTRVKNKYLTVE